MKWKVKNKVWIAFLILLLIAILSDLSQKNTIENGTIERAPLGGEEKELSLVLDVEGLFEDETYLLEVPPTQPTEKEAKEYFKKAIATIEKEFATLQEQIPIHASYEEGMVKAEWLLDPYGVVDTDGNIQYDKVAEKGEVINAQVKLTCGAYEEIYQFSFFLSPIELTQTEILWQQLEEWMEQQTSQEGVSSLKLPTEINGKEISWREAREYITPQILCLEIAAGVLFWLVAKRKKDEEKKKQIGEMERDYPEIVNQLSLLLGAGMTTRQAWGKLAEQYTFKKKEGMIKEREVYEAIARMSRRFSEGESERVIYQQFSQEIPAICFHKLVRILLGNLEKGTQGICGRLEEECRVAYEQRIQQAKKLGEEASTKMVFPLVLMLVLVMGIVMLPALMEFQI